jgi:hypothetical protein
MSAVYFFDTPHDYTILARLELLKPGDSFFNGNPAT